MVEYSENILPVFTSNTSHPPMVVSASSWVGDDQPYKAVEGFVGARPFWYVLRGANNWWKIDFGEGKKIGKIKMGTATISGSSHGIKNYEVFGSFDDNTYFSLLAGTRPNNTISQTIELQNVKKYQYYKIIVYDSYYSNESALIKDLAMYELLESKKILLKSANNEIHTLLGEGPSLTNITDNIQDVDNITKEEWEDYGFADLSPIDQTLLSELNAPIKLLAYQPGVDNTTPPPRLRQEYSLNVGVRKMITKPL